MAEGQQDYSQNTQMMSSTDMMKRRNIEFVFDLCAKACRREEPLAEYSYETGFIRGTKLAKSIMWKYTPAEIRVAIKDLYQMLDEKLLVIEQNEKLNDQSKNLSKQKAADEISLQVLEFLLVVLQYSPLSTEFKSAEIFSNDFPTIIAAIRSKERVKLFAGEIEGDEEKQ